MAKRQSSRKKKQSFMKTVLLLAFVQVTIFTIWQMIVFTVSGNEASTLIQWFYTLWGMEVGLLMLKRILDGKKKSSDEEGVM